MAHLQQNPLGSGAAVGGELFTPAAGIVGDPPVPHIAAAVAAAVAAKAAPKAPAVVAKAAAKAAAKAHAKAPFKSLQTSRRHFSLVLPQIARSASNCPVWGK